METTSLPKKGCKIWVYARPSGPFSRERSLSCHTYCDTGPRFFRSHPKDASFSRLLRDTRECGSILTGILTGLHTVAFNDTQGDAEDLLIFWPGSSRVSWSRHKAIYKLTKLYVIKRKDKDKEHINLVIPIGNTIWEIGKHGPLVISGAQEE
jgi:hypothetical protein